MGVFICAVVAFVFILRGRQARRETDTMMLQRSAKRQMHPQPLSALNNVDEEDGLDAKREGSSRASANPVNTSNSQ